MSEKGPEPEDSGELMYVKCAYCGKWLDVKPGQMNWVSHGLCDDCLKQELEKFKNPVSESPPASDHPLPRGSNS